MSEIAVTLLSGGLDSAASLWWAKHQGWSLHALTFNYYLRHGKELEATRKIAEAAGVKQEWVIDLPFLKEMRDAQTGDREDLPAFVARLPSGYIPSRNLIFYGIAAHLAEVIGAKYIVGGHNAADFGLFPDSAPEYLRLLNNLLNAGSRLAHYRPIRIVTPLAGMTKGEIILLAREMGVPIQLTWSCHEVADRPCGSCRGCVSRIEAFKNLGLEDPSCYESTAQIIK